MIRRTLQPHLERLASQFPAVTLTGPRQSGKTTLARMTFPDLPYVSLENPAERAFAVDDPVGFLDRYRDGGVLDEVQRVPDLLSFIQPMIDEDPRPGRFVLTGSHNLALLESVSQSLAGRTALLELLPLSLEEVRRFPDAPDDLDQVLWTGGYPRIHEQHLLASDWLAAYTGTYLERDVRSLLDIGDLEAFQTFLRVCAGRSAQVLNLSSLGADCGVSQPTARRWMSVLETSYIVFRLPPFLPNFGKRLVKRPKLYFHDVGLMAHLLGIDDAAQIRTHPLRGAIFETWVVGEVLKSYRHHARQPHLSFYRDRDRLEVDLIIEHGADLTAIEIKSGATPSTSYFSAFPRLDEHLRSRADNRWRLDRRAVVYGGTESQRRTVGELIAWHDVQNAAGLSADER